MGKKHNKIDEGVRTPTNFPRPVPIELIEPIEPRAPRQERATRDPLINRRRGDNVRRCLFPTVPAAAMVPEQNSPIQLPRPVALVPRAPRQERATRDPLINRRRADNIRRRLFPTVPAAAMVPEHDLPTQDLPQPQQIDLGVQEVPGAPTFNRTASSLLPAPIPFGLFATTNQGSLPSLRGNSPVNTSPTADESSESEKSSFSLK